MPLVETLFPLGIAHYLIGSLIIGLAVSKQRIDAHLPCERDSP